jgi:hypothetical protein
VAFIKVVFPAESRAKAETALTVSMDLKQPDQQQVQDIHTWEGTVSVTFTKIYTA